MWFVFNENLEKATGGEFAADSKVIDRFKEEILEIYGSIKEKKGKN